MIAVLKREIKNYVTHPLFWIGVLIVVYGVFRTTSPYLTTHYLKPGEQIVNDFPETSYSGDVHEGYIPAASEKHRELWYEKLKQSFRDEFDLSEKEIEETIAILEGMKLEEAYAYLEKEYDWYGARYLYEDTTYYKGIGEEINAYLDEKMEQNSFSFYYSRKFADFAGLFMGFFATILLSVLYFQDMKKDTYELLHTKPITAGKYIMGKVGAGFCICLIILILLNVVFWALCCLYTRESGFEARIWDFIVATICFLLPNMLMIVSVYTLISLLFRTPLPGIPLLILYMVYSNMGGRNAEGVYGYVGRPLAIMVRFPGAFFDTTQPPMAAMNQSFLILASAALILISVQLWKRRRV